MELFALVMLGILIGIVFILWAFATVSLGRELGDESSLAILMMLMWAVAILLEVWLFYQMIHWGAKYFELC